MKNYKISPLIADLKHARNSLAMTQAQLASSLEVPQSYVSKLESCSKDPRLSTVIEWGRLLGLELMFVPKDLVLAIGHIIGSEQDESNDTEPSTFQPLPEDI